MKNIVCFERKLDHGMDNFLDISHGNYDVLEDITNKRCTNEITDESWKLFIDGSCSKNGLGIGMVIKSPHSNIHLHGFKL